jgi:hypothetical protein
MEQYKTNRHYNFSIGLPIEYYEAHIKNSRDANDTALITLSRLFRGIVGAEDPFAEALKFANFLIENGVNLLPCIIQFYVDKFKSLPTKIQSHIINNTPTTNNYFREDSGSDKISFFANTEEYRTISSCVMSNNNQKPQNTISNNLKNKISPYAFSETVSLSKMAENMVKKSQATPVDQTTYNTISQNSHNNFRTITPTTNHVEAAELSKSTIEADSYKKFDDCYRLNREYIFKSNPYDISHRQDNTVEYMVDANKDIVGKDKTAVYTTAGNRPLSNTLRVQDFYAVMPPSREESNKLSKTKDEEKSPIAGGSGTDTSKQNEAAGKDPIKTYSIEKLDGKAIVPNT